MPLAALALVAVPAPPVLAQDTEAEVLAQIDASLPGALINNPISLDWRVAGDRVRVSAVVDPTIPGGGAATQYDVRRAGNDPWDIQAYVPLTRSIAAGETITFGLWARSVESRADDGLGQVTARIQRDANPWPGFGDTSFAIGPEWRWHEARAAADIAIPQREAFLVFQLAGTQQIVEIGQTFVVSDADSILGDGAPPPVQLPPQLEGRGQLVSLPNSRDWTVQGPAESWAARDDGTIYLGRAVQFTSPVARAQPWEIQAKVPLSQALVAGDALEIAVAAKTVSAATPDGKASIGIRVQQTAAPYDGFGDNAFSVGPGWQLIRIRTTADMDMPAGRAEVVLNFAGAAQVVDVGPVYVLKLDPGQ